MRREFGCPQISQINKENRMREVCLNFLFSRLKKICANRGRGNLRTTTSLRPPCSLRRINHEEHEVYGDWRSADCADFRRFRFFESGKKEIRKWGKGVPALIVSVHLC